jgi:hypothetical protein
MKRNQFQVLATVTKAEDSRNERKHMIIKAALHMCHVAQHRNWMWEDFFSLVIGMQCETHCEIRRVSTGLKTE